MNAPPWQKLKFQSKENLWPFIPWMTTDRLYPCSRIRLFQAVCISYAFYTFYTLVWKAYRPLTSCCNTWFLCCLCALRYSCCFSTKNPLIKTGHLKSCLDVWSLACALAVQKKKKRSCLAFNHGCWHCSNLSFLTVLQRQNLRWESEALTWTSRERDGLCGQEQEKYEMTTAGLKGFQSEKGLLFLCFR